MHSFNGIQFIEKLHSEAHVLKFDVEIQAKSVFPTNAVKFMSFSMQSSILKRQNWTHSVVLLLELLLEHLLL